MKFKERTRTDNPKGKVGKVFVNNWTIPFGQPKVMFRKFEKKPFDDADGFIKALEKKGFKRLGSGAFSTVLAKDGSDRVIKVIRRPDGWINYVHWAAQIGEAGHFAPKVFSYKKIKLRKGEIALASMERLEYDLENADPNHALKILPELLYRAEHNGMAAKFTETLAPGLISYLTKMKKQWNAEKWWNFDLHSGNLMVRKDGSFVIVDPVSRGAEGFTRLKEGDFSPSVVLISLISLIGFVIESSTGH